MFIKNRLKHCKGLAEQGRQRNKIKTDLEEIALRVYKMD
jgi:hypothetical protein